MGRGTTTDKQIITAIEHAGVLEDVPVLPPYLVTGHARGVPQTGAVSCSFCGVGDGAILRRDVVPAGAVASDAVRTALKAVGPTAGCVKLKASTMARPAAYPIHTAPSVLDRETGERRYITYEEAVRRLADALLDHRLADTRTLVYASGQVDYFTIFAMQEVLRILGVRNLTGNAEHCLNAGAVHNEILTGQEGPYLTIDGAIRGEGRTFLFNGWNGMISHPPVFRELMRRDDLDAYLVEVMETESAKALADKLGEDRVLLIRPRGDAHLALAVAHEVLLNHPEAVDQRFVDQFADLDSFRVYEKLAMSDEFSPENVAARIAPEPQYRERLLKGIRGLAATLASSTVPVVIPSVGLSQSSGVVAHCLWGNLLAMLGKYGLRPDGTPAGGVLRLPGQINAESEVQGLSRKYFLGRIPMAEAAEAARRMGLPDDAYDRAVQDEPRAALDYSDPTPGDRELILCVGTQFEANMPNRRRWLDKLTDPANTLVVIDPIPDPWSIRNADLIIPSPPHPAATKLYQNGEWRLTLSVPQKQAAEETRTDATILYDVMARIVHRLQAEPTIQAEHADLVPHLASGYLAERFCDPSAADGGGLPRIDGEVSRPVLWDRVQAYLHGGSGPLYCSFDHSDGTPIAWDELVEQGSLHYGGVGVNRYVLDYDTPGHSPFGDVYRRPRPFTFFAPTRDDVVIPDGVILNSGRSSLSDDRDRIQFATSTFNSGKATSVDKMPDEHPLYVSPALAARIGLTTGSTARVRSAHHDNGAIELPVVVSDRVKGDSMYVSFHRSAAQDRRGLYVNDVTDHEARCAYTSQAQLKTPRVHVELVAPAESPRPQVVDTSAELATWSSADGPLRVTEVFEEAPDMHTFRLQADSPRKFVYRPGQYCSVVLNIDGRRVVRSYSVSSSPSRPYSLEFTVKRVEGGLVSNWLPDHVRAGDTLQLKDFRGRFCLEPDSVPEKVLLIGAGSGMTPLMSMSRWLCDVSAPVDAVFYASVRTLADAPFAQELGVLERRHATFRQHLVPTRPVEGDPTALTGRVNADLLMRVVPDLHERHVYLCGPDGFMDRVREVLDELGFDTEHQLHVESFGAPRIATPEDESGTDLTVTFARTGKSVRSGRSTPLLDLAEINGVELESGCRAGSCGDCKVKVLSGTVSNDCTDGLTEDGLAQGYTLACVAAPTGDCVVDA